MKIDYICSQLVQMTQKFLVFLTLLLCGFSMAQVRELNPPETIKSITFKSKSNPLGELPILKLGEAFDLEFDALVSNEPDFYYKIKHYNYDWTPSILVRTEFLQGVDNQRIQNYRNSFNTYQLYSHYKLSIPNAQTQGLKVTGNYMIFIYNSFGEEIFSRKFMIYQSLVTPGISIKRSRNVKTIETTQTVDIEVAAGTKVNNPLQTINTLIIQNSNLNTAITNVKPQYTIGNKLIYRYVDKTAFPGGNEYLFFETKDVRSASQGVQFIQLEDIYNTFLFINRSRAELPYTYNPDINGRFAITALDTDDTSVEADYTLVHFALNYPKLTDGSQIYVYGNYNNYALDDYNQLRYNPATQRYETQFRLKQGFYNYKYVIVDAKGKLNEGKISGNFWQTENDYKVLLYYRDLGGRYDRIIGFNQTSSTQISN